MLSGRRGELPGFLQPSKCIDKCFAERAWVVVKFTGCSFMAYIPIATQCSEGNAGVERSPPPQAMKGSKQWGADAGYAHWADKIGCMDISYFLYH